jgi:hypothetical protein
MISLPSVGIHNWVYMTKLTSSDHSGTYNKMKCTKCGLIGRREGAPGHEILVSDTFSENRIKNCVRDNFMDKYIGKQIQIHSKMPNTKSYSVAIIYSVHTVIPPPAGFVNGEGGRWIMGGEGVPIIIRPDECLSYPLLPMKRNKSKRLAPTKSKRTSPIIVKPKRTT